MIFAEMCIDKQRRHNYFRYHVFNLYILEDLMFEVTKSAEQQIEEFFKDKEIRPIRLFLNQSG
jgi:hypothetical protein